MSSITWTSIPAELNLAVLQWLPQQDLLNFGLTSMVNSKLCISSLYRDVHLDSIDSIRLFLERAPLKGAKAVRHLTVSTKLKPTSSYEVGHLCGPWDLPEDHESASSDVVKTLLERCSELETLELALCGTLLPVVMPAFTQLARVHTLKVTNVASEEHLPVSERLVVSLASVLPRLATLEICGIARSLIHAPELLGSFPTVPIADDEVDEFPPSPIAPDLKLPELMKLPRLRRLSIRDTHLGDSQWQTAPVSATLETLILGAPCAFEEPTTQQEHVTALLANPALSACKTFCDASLGVPARVVTPKSGPVPSALSFCPEEPAEDEVTSPVLTPTGRSTKFPSLTSLVIDNSVSPDSGSNSGINTPALSTALSSAVSSSPDTPIPSLAPMVPEYALEKDSYAVHGSIKPPTSAVRLTFPSHPCF